MKVAVLYNSAVEGGFLSEDIKYIEDAIANAQRIRDRLVAAGSEAKLVEVTRQGLRGQLEEVKDWADVAFNLTEAVGLGLVLEVISGLEELGIAFAGASAYGHKLTSDKVLMKQALRQEGIPTPDWQVYTRENQSEKWTGKFPVIVKAATEHGSMSIHQDAVAKNLQEMSVKVEQLLNKYGGLAVLVEEYIDGAEINSTVIGSWEWAKCLPLSEMVFEGSYKKPGKWPIYTYEAKYNHGTEDFEDVPARIVDWLSAEETREIEEMSVKVCRVTECFDYARTDIRYDEKTRTPYIVDLNSYPCLLDDEKNDTIGISRAAWGWDYTKLLLEIAESGIKRRKRELSGSGKKRAGTVERRRT